MSTILCSTLISIILRHITLESIINLDIFASYANKGKCQEIFIIIM